MPSTISRSKLTWTLAAAAFVGAAVVVIPATRKLRSSTASEDPATIVVTGILRDFPRSHPDFETTASDGPGHYAGLISMHPGYANRPVFDGKGYRVISEATDAAGNAIPPHLAGVACTPGPRNPPLIAEQGMLGLNTGTVDSYDSRMGPYGGPNSGWSAVVATLSEEPGMITLENSSRIRGNVMISPTADERTVVDVKDAESSISGSIERFTHSVGMPSVSAPEYPPFDGLPVPMTLQDDEVATISSDMHLSTLLFGQRSQLTILGDVTIVARDEVEMQQSSRLIIPPGSKLTIFCRGRMKLTNQAFANPDTSAPERLQVVMLGTNPVGQMLDLRNQAEMSANVVAPFTMMQLEQTSAFYGTFVGRTICVANSSLFHADMSGYYGSGEPPPDDTPAVLAPTPGDGGISSTTSFSQWFLDLPGTNMAAVRPITFVRQADATYLYDDALDPRFASLGGFWPADGELLGNQGAAHNHNFTYYFAVMFEYDASAGQYLTCHADADVWVFIDDLLAIDLGGLRPDVLDQRIDLDRLCLEDGQTYRLSFYMAEREGPGSKLRIETNICFRSGLPGANLQYD